MKKKSHSLQYRWYIFGGIVMILVYFIASLGDLRIFLPTYLQYSGFPFFPKTYLIVLQNNAELRPGGGFISAVAKLRFVAGIPVGFSIQDVYNLSSVVSDEQPPEPLKKAIVGPDYRGWIFQDANYFADFPTNAQKLITLYQKFAPDEQIDGVIAVNTSLIERVLGVLGSVSFGDEAIDAVSLFPKLEFAVNNIDRHNVEDLKTRKDVLKTLFRNIALQAITSPLKYGQISSALSHGFSEKEAQIYFTSSSLQKTFSDRGWTNSIDYDGKSDFLGVVEANLGGMKSDAFIDRSVRSIVEIPVDGGFPKVTVQIRMAHHGVYNEPLSFTYKGFVRILVPEGSLLLSSRQVTGDSREQDVQTITNPHEMPGLASFGQEVKIEPGEEKTIEFTYQIPIEVIDKYRLHIHKQPGTDDPYFVAVHKGDDSIFYPITPLRGQGEFDSRGSVAFYQAVLKKDIDLALKITPDQIPPRLTFQKFLSLNTIELHTNEPIDRRSCETVGNFVLTDGNVNHQDVTDQPRIINIVCNGQGITLTVSGVSKQNEEHYKLNIKNMTDRSGNTMSPSPREFTVVQR